MKVGIGLAALGGYGDLFAKRKIAEYALAEGVEVRFVYDDVLIDKINSVFAGIRIRRLGPNERVDIAFAVNTSFPSYLDTAPFKVEISDYGIHPLHYRGDRRYVNIGTSFKFEHSNCIQSGLFFSDQDRKVIQKALHDPVKNRQAIQKFLKDIGIDIDLGGGKERERTIGLYYPSSFANDYIYLQLVKKLSQQMNNPIVFFPYLEYPGHPTKMRDMGLGYRSKEHNISGDGVQVINPGNIPHDIFLKIMAASDIPFVVTGVHSTTEAIQLVLEGGKVPFFHHLYPFTKKIFSDFCEIAFRQHDISRILVGYIKMDPSKELKSREDVRKLRSKYGSATPEEIEKFFLDKELHRQFLESVRGIPNTMLEQRRGHVKNPEATVYVENTVRHIIRAVRDGREQDISDLLNM